MKDTQLLYRPATAMAGFFLAAVLGALLQPLLSGALGTVGMAYYSLAMPAYYFLTIAGALVFPVIIGRMLAPFAANGETGEARALFADSLLALVLPGAVLGVIAALLASPISAVCGLPGGAPALVGIAPLYLLSMAAAALRGYFVGMGYYGYYALSLLVQQIAKVLFASLLAGLGKGNPAGMAQWACFGICIAEGLSLLVLTVFFGISGRRRAGREEQPYRVSIGSLAKRLWTAGGLASLLASLFALFSIVDALVIPGRFDAALLNPSAAAGGYALLASFALPVVLFPGAMCAFIALLGLGGVFAAKAENNRAELSARIALSTKGALLLSIPAAMTVGILAKPLLTLLFSSALTGAQLNTAAEIIQLLSAGLVFAAVGTANAMQLCATGHTAVGIVNAAAALLIKLVLTLLLATAERTVFGGAFATVAALFAFCAFNAVQVTRRTRAEFDAANSLVKPAICAACMGAAMYFLYFALLEKLMGAGGSILAALGGYLIYIALAVALRVLTANDLSRLPFGPRLYDILNKTGMVK